MTINGLVHSHYYLSNYNEMKINNDLYYQSAKKSGDIYAIIASNIYYTQYHREKGNLDKAEEHGLEAKRLSQEMNDLFNLCSTNIELGITYIHMGKTQKAIKVLEEAVALYNNNLFLKQYTAISHQYITEAYIDNHMARQQGLNKKEEQQSLQKINRICKKAWRIMKVWSTHYGTMLRIMAKYYFINKDNNKADEFFNLSIDYLTKHRRKYHKTRVRHGDVSGVLSPGVRHGDVSGQRPGKSLVCLKQLQAEQWPSSVLT